ncbi:MAG TPA: hypothetical protein VKA82_07400 [Rubrobacter sp.]|nr:hypothetical protein [Rubrobacter sp.]
MSSKRGRRGDGKTWLKLDKLDKGMAAALSDAGVKVQSTGAAVGPTAKVAGTGQRIALLRLGAPEGANVGDGRIVLRGVDAKLTAQAAKALNEALDTDLFEGGLLIGEATVIAKYDDKGEDDNDD